jgi:hypothetical protein
MKNIIQVPEKNILQHDMTFCKINQSINHKMNIKSELLTDLLALHKIRRKVDTTHT